MRPVRNVVTVFDVNCYLASIHIDFVYCLNQTIRRYGREVEASPIKSSVACGYTISRYNGGRGSVGLHSVKAEDGKIRFDEFHIGLFVAFHRSYVFLCFLNVSRSLSDIPCTDSVYFLSIYIYPHHYGYHKIYTCVRTYCSDVTRYLYFTETINCKNRSLDD